MSEEDLNQSYRTRMQCKKELVDQKINAAKGDVSVLLVNSATARSAGLLLASDKT